MPPLTALPRNNYTLGRPPSDATVFAGALEVPVCAWLATVNRALGAGFYSDHHGPLPFAFGAVPPERFEVMRVTRGFGAAGTEGTPSDAQGDKKQRERIDPQEVPRQEH